jgi:hypothetical protein
MTRTYTERQMKRALILNEVEVITATIKMQFEGLRAMVARLEGLEAQLLTSVVPEPEPRIRKRNGAKPVIQLPSEPAAD